MKWNPEAEEARQSKEMASVARRMSDRKKGDPYWRLSYDFWRERAKREAERAKKGGSAQ